jgi:hypothetical protein
VKKGNENRKAGKARGSEKGPGKIKVYSLAELYYNKNRKKAERKWMIWSKNRY